MKKLTRIIAPVALAAALGACEPAKNVDAVGPVINSAGTAEAGNDALRTMTDVFLEIAPEINNLDHGFFDVTDRADFDEKDIEQEAKIKSALRAVFPESKMRKFMNFDDGYLNSVIDEISIIAARACECHPGAYNGFFSNKDEHIQIVSKAGEEGGAAEDAMALLHEMGHALGLGERLAQYFAEKTLGLGVMSPDVQKYNTMYDRELENRMGEKEFWKTAFSTEDEYRQAWDKNMKDIMPYYEFLDVLSVSDMLRDGMFAGNEQDKGSVLREFPAEESQTIYDIRTFQSLFADYLVSKGDYKDDLGRLMQEYAGKMHAIAMSTSLPTNRAVMDGFAPPRNDGIGITKILEALDKGFPTAHKIAILLALMMIGGHMPLETLRQLSGKKQKYINFSRDGIRIIEKDRKGRKDRSC